MLACVVTWIDYFNSPKSFDKLHAEYARAAVQAVSKAAASPSVLVPPTENTNSTSDRTLDRRTRIQRLLALPPKAYLRAVQDSHLQLELRLVHPYLHALYTLQTLLVLSVVFVGLFISLVTLFSLRALGAASPPALSQAFTAAFVAVGLFALWVIAFRQYRLQLKPVVGDEVTILPHVFAGGVIVLILGAMATLSPEGKFQIAQLLSPRLVPVVLLASGIAAEARWPELFNLLIGAQTNLGIQLMWMVVVLVAGGVLGVVFWPTPGRV
jgi:hypothetical protein